MPGDPSIAADTAAATRPYWRDRSAGDIAIRILFAARFVLNVDDTELALRR
jgi:hypothetical protein